jgi:hypothetical protein
MFQALFAHHQGALRIQQLVCFVRIMSAGCYQVWSFIIVIYAVHSDDDDDIVLETCRSY